MAHPETPVNQIAFDDACGVGVVVTPEQIEQTVCIQGILINNNAYKCLVIVTFTI